MTDSNERSGEPLYEVFSPVSPQRLSQVGAADELDGLDGARVAFVWDYLFQGPQVKDLAAKLQADFEGLTIVGYDTFGDIHGQFERQVLDRLPDLMRDHAVGAAVVGIGA